MPTIHREAGFAFRFRAGDAGEPPHIHVEGHGGRAKFWLADGRLAGTRGYNPRHLGAIERIVAEHRQEWLDIWHDFFD